MSAELSSDDCDRLPLLGRAQDTLRFILALPEGGLEDKEDPFLPLSDSGRLSRVLLGGIAAGKSATVFPLAVKIQRSTYRPGKAILTNLQIDERWERERESLQRAGGGDVVSLLDLGAGSSRQRPVTFCKKVRAWFHPFCPTCRGPLADCRDDALLREHGLPEYSKSASRYLYCRACAPTKRVFYTAATGTDEALRGGAEVRRRGELYRDMAAVFKEKLSDADRRKLSEAYACFDCGHRAACYPATTGKPVPAESLLVPLSYNEFHLLPLEAMDLHYDEFCDLAGGASWEAVRARILQTAPGREALLKPLDAVFQGPRQYLYQGDVAGRFSLEILRLKLSLFSQLASGLRRYHATCKQAHLDLDPSKVMVKVGAAGSSVPARWAFQAKLIGLASPHRSIADAGGSEAARSLLHPAPDADPTYLSPFVRGKGAGGEESMRVSIRSAAAEGDQVRLQGTVASERVRLDAYRPRDVIRIVPSSPVGWLEGHTLWGVLGEREDRAWTFSALLPRSASRDPAKKVPDFEAAVAFYRTFQVPCDLYGLGMLLFRALVVNDEHDLFAVDDTVQRILKKLSLRFEGKNPAERQVRNELAGLIEQERAVLSPSALFFNRSDREERPAAIPSPLWRDLVAFGFRLMTAMPGFSFCADHSDYPADRPEAVLEKVLVELTTLERRAGIELFSRTERDREISEVCADLLAELAAADAPKTGA